MEEVTFELGLKRWPWANSESWKYQEKPFYIKGIARKMAWR